MFCGRDGARPSQQARHGRAALKGRDGARPSRCERRRWGMAVRPEAAPYPGGPRSVAAAGERGAGEQMVRSLSKEHLIHGQRHVLASLHLCSAHKYMQIWAQIYHDVGAERMAGRTENPRWPRADSCLAIGGISSGHTANRVPVGGGTLLPTAGNAFPHGGSRPAPLRDRIPLIKTTGCPPWSQDGQNESDKD